MGGKRLTCKLEIVLGQCIHVCVDVCEKDANALQRCSHSLQRHQFLQVKALVQ